MHRSRVGVALIDHPVETHDAALGFWAAATGRTPHSSGADEYNSLGRHGGWLLEVQRTGSGTPARVHLDVETDDVAAETHRLLDLGARVLEDRDGYTILEDPGGLVFCVVPVQTGAGFEAEAATWE